jgi:hypothetical protein
MVQDAEDSYYLNSKYILELVKRAYELFMRSEVEEKRELLKLTLSNLTLDGKTVRFQVQKPFDTILEHADGMLWGGIWDSNPRPCLPQRHALTS